MQIYASEDAKGLDSCPKVLKNNDLTWLLFLSLNKDHLSQDIVFAWITLSLQSQTRDCRWIFIGLVFQECHFRPGSSVGAPRLRGSRDAYRESAPSIDIFVIFENFLFRQIYFQLLRAYLWTKVCKHVVTRGMSSTSNGRNVCQQICRS